nr:hypothetical protein [Prevotella sp.]
GHTANIPIHFISIEDGHSFTLSGVKDMYGNPSNSISWDAHFELSMFEWFVSANNTTIGAFDKPAIFTTGRIIEQDMQLAAGWNWKSFFVNPNRQGALSSVMEEVANEVDLIKSKTQMADQYEGQWRGTLQRVEAGQMYKVHTTVPCSFVVRGELTDINTPISIHEGWNWIGSTSHYNIPIDEAFLNLNPRKDDYIKSKTAFAIYDGHGKWNGTLTAIEPGEGYKLLSQQDGTLIFPNVSGYASARRMTTRAAGYISDNDYADYADNMNMVMRIMAGGCPLTDATVSVYIDASLRGQTDAIDGLYYLTVAGNPTDTGKRLTLVISHAGEDLIVNLDDVIFATDEMHGSSSQPYVLQLDDLSGIATVSSSPADDDEFYDLQGRRLDVSPTRGLYIVRHRKQGSSTVRLK